MSEAKKRAALQVMRDVIESTSGDVVDVAAWDFDQLVRVLQLPNELFAVVRAIEGALGTTEYNRAEQAIRVQLMGEGEARKQIAMHERLVDWYEEDIRRRIARDRGVADHRRLMVDAQASLDSSRASLAKLLAAKHD